MPKILTKPLTLRLDGQGWGRAGAVCVGGWCFTDILTACVCFRRYVEDKMVVPSHKVTLLFQQKIEMSE